MENREEKDNKMNRRAFLIKSLWGLSAVTTTLLAIPVVGVLLEPLFRVFPIEWRRVGRVEDFKAGQTVLVSFKDATILPWSGETSKTASWLRRTYDDKFQAFSVNCTHLGCPVRWIEDAGLFLCPCHGGVYNQDGSYAAGPPPGDLPRYPVRIRDGYVEIQASEVPITNLRMKKK
ncbi:MAG: ubiquinol-cytochrome c reductase iron-sulfur subunit [Syntrophothermus sp.]